jgi:hypothetical protein
MRYMGPELFSVYDEDNDSPSPGVTKATDVYAFAVTVIEVGVSVSVSLSFPEADTIWVADIHRICSLLAYQKRCHRHHIRQGRRSSQTRELPVHQQRNLDGAGKKLGC